MDTDVILVIGSVLCALSIPSLLAAFAESRPPRTGILMILIGGIMIVYAVSQSNAGYTFAELPDVFMRVVGRLFN